jgi:hypothetical protein
MNAQTTSAIALRPTRRLNCQAWTKLPMPNKVIQRVHTLARRSRNDRGLIFLDQDGQPFLDDADDDSKDEEEYFPNGNNDYAEDELFSDDE